MKRNSFFLERQKYVDALMKIAVRVNDAEDKATTCVKEARTQLKKVIKHFSQRNLRKIYSIAFF
jgi:hypothetical protein